MGPRRPHEAFWAWKFWLPKESNKLQTVPYYLFLPRKVFLVQLAYRSMLLQADVPEFASRHSPPNSQSSPSATPAFIRVLHTARMLLRCNTVNDRTRGCRRGTQKVRAVYNGEKNKKVPRRRIEMELFVFPPFSIFVENDYVQHAGPEYLCHNNLRYHVNFVSDDIKLPDVIQYSYGGNLPIWD